MDAPRPKDPIGRLVQLLSRLPGVGEKTATRLAFFILRADRKFTEELAASLLDVATRIRACSRCMDFSEDELCAICSDARRDPSVICVVEQPADLRAIERTREYRGRYHVLHGALAPLDGVGPDQLRVKELLARLSEERGVSEIIVATNPTVEGEATALYLARVLGPTGLKVSRIASGMPIGGDLEYADPATISSAFAGRRVLSS